MYCAEANGDLTPVHFVGKEREWSNTESPTGLDIFSARFYSSNLGLFVAPDPENAGGDASDPQSWNGYAYARGNPVINTDPDGRACISTDNGESYHDDNSGGQTCA